ncbi:pentapeptide repeat-containing protein [Singulisphaera sp. PoT]|uniref:pentapeptide repeat-containing protein n=1 Tax=Singulisphaera sp. PoT TaxID=3411797 RepID=UPI003BF482DB
MEAAEADFRGADMRQANLGGAYLLGAVLPPLAAGPPSTWPSEIAKAGRGASATQESVKGDGAEQGQDDGDGHSM